MCTTIAEKKELLRGILEKLDRQEGGLISFPPDCGGYIPVINPNMDKGVNGIISGEFFAIPCNCKCGGECCGGKIFICVGLGKGSPTHKTGEIDGIWFINAEGKASFAKTTNFAEIVAETGAYIVQ